MTKKFYIQTDENNRVTDICNIKADGYKETELKTPLPYNILAGCYELMSDNSIVYRKEWDNADTMQRLDDIEDALSELLFGGVEQ